MAQRARKQAGAGALSWSLENASWCHELELEPGAGAWRMLARAGAGAGAGPGASALAGGVS